MTTEDFLELMMKQMEPLLYKPEKTALLENVPNFRRHTDDIPIPPIEVMQRIGTKTVEDYVRQGREDACAIMSYFVQYSAQAEDLQNGWAPRILDLGCGCGRIARNFSKVMLTGIDVDPVGIAWCNENLRTESFYPREQFRFFVSEENPQHTLENIGGYLTQFDLIYSVSIFTHMTEQRQDELLRFINDLLLPDGIAVLTVHGMWALRFFDEWAMNTIRGGFVDSGMDNPDIADVVSPGFYRNVAHTPAYIMEHWSQFIDVEQIYIGGLSHQDVVICRKKGT